MLSPDYRAQCALPLFVLASKRMTPDPALEPALKVYLEEMPRVWILLKDTIAIGNIGYSRRGRGNK